MSTSGLGGPFSNDAFEYVMLSCWSFGYESSKGVTKNQASKQKKVSCCVRAVVPTVTGSRPPGLQVGSFLCRYQVLNLEMSACT